MHAKKGTESLSNVFLIMEQSKTYSNLLKMFWHDLSEWEVYVKESLKMTNGLKIQAEVPDLTIHAIKGYATLTKPTRLK